MHSVEDEFSEIEVDWELKYLDSAEGYRYTIELKKEEVPVALIVHIPEEYPVHPPHFEFGEKEMKGLNEDMQQCVLQVTRQCFTPKTGKPVLKLALENFLKQFKSAMAESDINKSNNTPKASAVVPKKRKKGRPKYKLAIQFGLVTTGQTMPADISKTLQTVKESQKPVEKILKKPAIAVEKDVSPAKQHRKAPPMKTARDVINRFKWDGQLKTEEFIVGYEDRFSGIVEVPVFELNWQDDIASTGPNDQLAIPEHRVQHFKWNSHIVWEKKSRTDLVFGSTGSKIDIVEFIQRQKKLASDKILGSAEVVSGDSEQRLNEPHCDTEPVVEMVVNDLIEKVENMAISQLKGEEKESLQESGSDVFSGDRNMESSANPSLEAKQGEEVTARNVPLEEINVKSLPTTGTEAKGGLEVTARDVSSEDESVKSPPNTEMETKEGENKVAVTSGDRNMKSSPFSPEKEVKEQGEEGTHIRDVLSEDTNIKSSSTSESDSSSEVRDEESIPKEFSRLFSMLATDLEKGITCSNSEAAPREVAGGTSQHGSRSNARSYPANSSENSHHNRGRHHQESDGKNNSTGNRSRKDGWDRDRGDGSRDRQPPVSSSSSRCLPNYCLAVNLEKNNEQCLKRFQSDHNLPPEEFLHINVATFTLHTRADAEELKKALESVCSNWSRISAVAKHASLIGDDVILAVEDSSLTKLFERLLSILKSHADSFCFSYNPHIKVATVQNDRSGWKPTIKTLHPKIQSMYIWQIGKSNLNLEVAHNHIFRLRGKYVNEAQRRRDTSTGQKRRLDEGPDARAPPKQKKPSHRYDKPEKDEQWETFISKRLAAVLRHNAMGLEVDEEGCIEVNTLLQHNFFWSKWVEEEDIVGIVRNNRKQRFTLEGAPGSYKVRANQGHTVQVESLHLLEIKDASGFPKVVHGTNMHFWESIAKTGLNKMGRNHIHMTTAEPHSWEEVISGMRNSSNCFIYIDIARAIADGIKFFLSDNNVILSEGNKGVIHPKYFSHAYGIKNGQRTVLLPVGPVPQTGTLAKARPPKVPGVQGEPYSQKNKNKKGK